MADYSAAGTLELNDPAEVVYDRHGVTVTMACITSTIDGNPPRTDVMGTFSVDSGTVTTTRDYSTHVPVSGTPGLYEGDWDGSERWTIWTSGATAVHVILQGRLVGDTAYWAVFETGEAAPTP